MPLHLLGKKSWNVYNNDNIERVKRDEADAQAKEEAAEQRLQQEDAQHRISILRGEKLPRLPSEERAELYAPAESSRPSKRRRLRGEDDTDKEIRWAREDAQTGEQATARLRKHNQPDVPLHDEGGHIQLVSAADHVKQDDAKQSRKVENEQGMRFTDAAGYKTGVKAPWYASSEKSSIKDQEALSALPEKNVWGNEDPRRREREKVRVTSNDPLAFMKQAQRQLKQSEQDRERFSAEQQAEIRQLQQEEKHRRKSARHKYTSDEHSIPELDLDRRDERHKHAEREHRKHHHRHRKHSRHSDEYHNRHDKASQARA